MSRRVAVRVLAESAAGEPDGYIDLMPEKLPADERVLWQGKPSWRALARRGFHLREFAIYFAVLLAWYAGTVFTSLEPAADAALATLRMTGVALVPLVLIAAYAWMTARSSLYTITDRRVVMRIGLAMPVTFNVPFSRIEQAGLKLWADGHGDLPLTLAAKEKLAYLVIWPHARPWHLARPAPMLRCVPDAERVAQVLSRALASAARMPVQAAESFSERASAQSSATVLA